MRLAAPRSIVLISLGVSFACSGSTVTSQETPAQGPFVDQGLRLKLATRIAQVSGGPPAAVLRVPRAGSTQVGLRSARARLSNGSPDWTDSAIEITHEFEKRKLLIGTLTDSSRFGLKDTTATIEGYYPFSQRLTGYAGVTASDTHRVLARDSVHGQLAYALDGGWGVLAGFKHATYNTTSVDTADFTLERYFSNYRAAFTVLPAHSRTAGSAASYRLAFGYFYGDENRIQILFGIGTEVDRPEGANLIVATSVRSTALFGRHWFSSAWALDYAIERTAQGTVTRDGLNVGLRYRF
ncbi:MAG: YaiO family outer membrane beta-barrel protein [Betaproteobacteria bacterium]|nr:YaiO family outer membrane beta-barrel protein [Betaproteobacteria bacterium]